MNAHLMQRPDRASAPFANGTFAPLGAVRRAPTRAGPCTRRFIFDTGAELMCKSRSTTFLSSCSVWEIRPERVQLVTHKSLVGGGK
jgi:hypothetical protein